MFRRPSTCLLHHLFALGASANKNGREIFRLSRRVADELVLSSIFSLCAMSDVSVPSHSKVFATDASLSRGGVTSRDVPQNISRLLWLGGDRKGAYTKLDNPFKEILKHVGRHEDELLGDEEAQPLDEAHLAGSPAPPIEFAFDFVEICGGAGVISKSLAALGYTVCTPIDLSNSPHFDLTSLDLVWWIIGMIKHGRFRSICVEPPCTSFSVAQHPSSRSYQNPLGFDRTDRKTWLGNCLAFRCLLLCWIASIFECPSLAEQPHLSKMAWLPFWQYLLSIGFVESVAASCQFGIASTRNLLDS